MHYRELPTPALAIDLDALERNLDRMAKYCREHDIRLRPHTKTHKTPEVAKMQLERGAVGLTVAKVGEAEVMAGAEPTGGAEMLIAYPVLGRDNLCRLATLARSRRILVSLDAQAAAQELSRAVHEQQAKVGI